MSALPTGMLALLRASATSCPPLTLVLVAQRAGGGRGMQPAWSNCVHGIVELLMLEKSSKIIDSNHSDKHSKHSKFFPNSRLPFSPLTHVPKWWGVMFL